VKILKNFDLFLVLCQGQQTTTNGRNDASELNGSIENEAHSSESPRPYSNIIVIFNYCRVITCYSNIILIFN